MIDCKVYIQEAQRMLNMIDPHLKLEAKQCSPGSVVLRPQGSVITLLYFQLLEQSPVCSQCLISVR